MKKVTCHLHFDDKHPGRCEAFKKFCLLFMLLGIWDKTLIVDIKTGDKRIWYASGKGLKMTIGQYKP